MADALFEAGLDDALPAVENGRLVLDVDREGETLTDVILSGIRQLQSLDLPVLRAEAAPLVTTLDVAARVGRTRQNVQQWATGKRGGGFPAPAIDGRNGTRLWRWGDVLEWLKQRAIVSDDAYREFVRREEVIAAINGMLSAKRLNQYGYNVMPIFSLVADVSSLSWKVDEE